MMAQAFPGGPPGGPPVVFDNDIDRERKILSADVAAVSVVRAVPAVAPAAAVAAAAGAFNALRPVRVMRVSEVDAVLAACRLEPRLKQTRQNRAVTQFRWEQPPLLQLTRRKVISCQAFQERRQQQRPANDNAGNAAAPPPDAEPPVLVLEATAEDLVLFRRMKAHALHQHQEYQRRVNRDPLSPAISVQTWDESPWIVAPRRRGIREDSNDPEDFVLRFKVPMKQDAAGRSVPSIHPLPGYGDTVTAIVNIDGFGYHRMIQRVFPMVPVVKLRIDARRVVDFDDFGLFFNAADQPAVPGHPVVAAAAAAAAAAAPEASAPLPRAISSLEQRVATVLKLLFDKTIQREGVRCMDAGDVDEEDDGAARPEGVAFVGEVAGDCTICMERVSDTVFVPCRHAVCCASCVEHLRDGGRANNMRLGTRCPVCRTDIAQCVPLADVPQSNRGHVWFA